VRAIRILRGIVRTAVAFAIPWAVFGGVLSAVIELVWNGPVGTRPLSYYFSAALSQVAPFAVGAVFAGFLAVAGRKLAFEQLTAPRVLGLGVTGALAAGGSFLVLMASRSGGWHTGYSVALGVAAVLGGASALSMLWIARRASAVRVTPELTPGADRTFEDRLARDAAQRAAT
jgi:hypothetical protein